VYANTSCHMFEVLKISPIFAISVFMGAQNSTKVLQIALY
jgi:hypothetical protein